MCALNGDSVGLNFAIKDQPKMSIQNYNDLYLKEGFLKVIKKDNNIIDKIELEGDQKILALFKYFKD